MAECKSFPALRKRLAKLLHLKLSAAQNHPYEDGETCDGCLEDVDTEFMPIVTEEFQALCVIDGCCVICRGVDIDRRGHQLNCPVAACQPGKELAK
jgi:hypothetical protein